MSCTYGWACEEDSKENWVYILLGFVFVIPAIIGIASCCGFIVTADRRGERLRAPLLTPSTAAPLRHRPEAAQRDADDGFTRCSFCAFENFKRFPFCQLCGTRLWAAARQLSIRSFSTDAILDASAQSQQQRRARTRKEWTRKLDIEQRLFWYRAGESFGEGDAPRCPGYTVAFRPNDRCDGPQNGATNASASAENSKTTIVILPPELPESEHQGASAMNQPSALSGKDQIEQTQPVALTKRSVVEGLDSETATIQQLVRESTAVEAGEIPIAIPDAGFERKAVDWRYVLDLATLDFPTKYARFVTSMASLLVQADQQYVTLSVHRDALLDDSMESLSIIPPTYIRSAMRIEFPGDCGVDAGGLQREWFMQLNQELAEPARGVFRYVNKPEQTYYLNPSAAHDIGEAYLMYYLGAGRLIGRALLEGQVMGFHLAQPLLKIILGIPVSFSDLEYFDPEAYKSMLWVKQNDGADTLGLDFSVMETRAGELVVVDLIPDGHNTAVTDANKELYLQRKFEYLLFESVSAQLYAFLKGIYQVIPMEQLAVFDPEELDYVLCGSDEINVADWKRSSRCSPILHRHSVMKWFWEIVYEMPNEYRRRLLHFATGSSRVPIAGFSALLSNDGQLSPFTLHAETDPKKDHIWSHTCFNRIGLPLYDSKEKLETVLYATLDMELYAFTTD